ncbi:MAG: twin-arginine translocase subunit TatC [Armatimonadota bacterium]|nr:twin-arginine translocase subunit TatC [Armatimonadota bacterium]
MAHSAEQVKKKKKKERKPPRESYDREMELTEHLAELRTRIIRSLLYVVAGLVVGWIYYTPILEALKAPIMGIKSGVEWRMVFTNFLEPFFVRLQVSLVAGVVLVFPFLLMEAWGFVSPALTRTERRAVYVLFPMCVSLFLGGVATAFFVMPQGIRWFLGFLPADTELMQKLNDYVVFLAKTSLAFGVMFQLPVVMLFLGKVGLVNSRFLTRYWRQAIVLAAAGAAIITPSADAFTMVCATVPLGVLYGLSILLVKLVERGERRSDGATANAAGYGDDDPARDQPED